MNYLVSGEDWEVSLATADEGLRFRTSPALGLHHVDTRLHAANFQQGNGDGFPGSTAGSYQIVPDLNIKGHFRYTLTRI